MSLSCCPWRVGRNRQKIEQSSVEVTRISSAPTSAPTKAQAPAPSSQSQQEDIKPQTLSNLPVTAPEESGKTPSLPPEPKPKEAPSQLPGKVGLPNSQQGTTDASHDKSPTIELKAVTEPILSGLRRVATDAEPTKDLWSNAYDDLKSNDSTMRLMEIYEKILSCEKLYSMMTEKKDGEDSQNIDTDTFEQFPNLFANLKREERVKKMQEIAEKGFERMDKRISSKVSKGMTEVTKLVNSSKSFISEALKGCESASLAWAGVCVFILPAIVNGFEQLDEQRKGLDYVNNRIKWYTGLHDILLSRKYWKDIRDPKFEYIFVEAKRAVGRLYCCLIEYQVRCVCTLFAKIGRAIINTIKNILVWDDWGGKLKEIEGLETQLKDYANTLLEVKHQDSLSALVHQGQNQVNLLSKVEAAIKTMVETNAQSNREQAERRSRKQLALFDGTKYNTLDQLVAVRKENTGNWLLEHEEFKKWESSVAGLLIVEANPGRGKSVLAKTVVKRLMDDTTKTTCYFFFTGRFENHNKATISLRALLHQLFTKKQDILLGLGNDIEKKNESFTDDFDALWEIFILATRKCDRGEIVCVLDALDECNHEDGKLLLQRLADEFKEDMPFRILITTRRNDDLRLKYELFQTYSVINLEEESGRLQSLSEDINAVIDQRFDTLVKKHRGRTPIPQRKHEAFKNILKGDVEQRTYLWVDLIFRYLDAVAAPGKPSGWDRVFTKLPDTYSTVYREFLQAVPPENQATVREIFELVAAAVEPLGVQPTNVAANIEFPKDVEARSGLEMSSSEGFQNWINSNCGFLVHVYDGKLYFIHQTAREFLLLSPTRSEPAWLQSFTIQACHQLAAERCIAYLSSQFLVDDSMEVLPIEDINPEIRDGTLEQYPFFVYSALYWLNHVTHASGKTELNIDEQRTLIHSILNAVTLEDPEALAKRLIRVSTMLGTGYRNAGALSLLMVSIGIAELAIRVSPLSHPYLPEWLQTLGNQLVLRFEKLHSIADLSRAIKLSREIVSYTPIDHPSLVHRLGCLASWLGKRFERTGEVMDLDEAIHLLEQVMSYIPANPPEKPNHLAALGYWLGRRFERTGTTDYLENAIALTQEAIELTPKGSPALSSRLANLSAQLGMRFQCKGNMDDVDHAIRLAEEALDATQNDDVECARQLQILSDQLVGRYRWTGEMHDLVRALELMQKAVSFTPEHHPDRPNRLAVFGERIGRKFERTGGVDDLARAVEQAKAALDDTPDDHPDRAGQLATLGGLIGQRFERTGDKSDIYGAIELVDRGLMRTPLDHPDRAPRLNTLGRQLARRFKETGDLQDISRAIDIAEDSVKITAREHPDLIQRICTLVENLKERHMRCGDLKDLEKATSCLEEAWDSRNSPPSSLIRLLRLQAQLLAIGNKWEASNRILFNAVHLLSTMCPRWLPLTDKQYLLSEFTGLASTAASVALNAGESAYDALQLLESGRAIIASQQLESSMDMAFLEQILPDIATEFVAYQRELAIIANRNYDGTPEVKSYSQALEHRREIEQKLEMLIQRIRTNPGFERFLLQPTQVELMAAADPDPIVVLNTSPYRCDAFIIERHQITALRLPDISASELEKRVRRWSHSSTLRWLWDNITSPCLKALGYEGVPTDEQWPHVWWVPTGPLSLLPIHAAGVHEKGSIDTVIDRVMSSYSLSVKTLMSLRQRRARQSDRLGDGNSLIVTMIHTPGTPNLPQVVEEGEMVEQRCTSMNWLPVMLRDPSREQVLEALGSCDLFHFTGNAKSNKTNPVENALLLSDWQTAPLTVADLSHFKRKRRPAFLSFLSTCDVASIGGQKLDEPMHLVGACLLGGFQHAIGPLGEVMDDDCYHVAKVFYESLQKEGKTDCAVYRALHKSVKKMRDEEVQDDTASDYGSEPDYFHRGIRPDWVHGRDHKWVSFVHFGV